MQHHQGPFDLLPNPGEGLVIRDRHGQASPRIPLQAALQHLQRSSQLPVRVSSLDEYTLGWIEGFLPSHLGLLSENTGLLSEMPTVGKGTKPQVVFSHTGSLAGFRATVIVLLEIETAIFVLVNIKTACDSSGFIAEAILEVVLDVPHKVDFVQLTETAMENAAKRYPSQAAELDASRVAGTQHKAFEAYTGRYEWTTNAFFVDILVDGEILNLKIQGCDDQIYPLKHYHCDTFTWLMTDEEEARRSRYVQATGAYKFVFGQNEVGKIDNFVRQEMGGGPGTFSKKG